MRRKKERDRDMAVQAIITFTYVTTWPIEIALSLSLASSASALFGYLFKKICGLRQNVRRLIYEPQMYGCLFLKSMNSHRNSHSIGAPDDCRLIRLHIWPFSFHSIQQVAFQLNTCMYNYGCVWAGLSERTSVHARSARSSTHLSR